MCRPPRAPHVLPTPLRRSTDPGVSHSPFHQEAGDATARKRVPASSSSSRGAGDRGALGMAGQQGGLRLGPGATRPSHRRHRRPEQPPRQHPAPSGAAHADPADPSSGPQPEAHPTIQRPPNQTGLKKISFAEKRRENRNESFQRCPNALSSASVLQAALLLAAHTRVCWKRTARPAKPAPPQRNACTSNTRGL